MPTVPEPQDGRLLTLEEVATWLQVSEGTLRRWCSQGLIPHIKLVQAYRFEPTQLQEWIDERTVSMEQVHERRRTDEPDE